MSIFGFICKVNAFGGHNGKRQLAPTNGDDVLSFSKGGKWSLSHHFWVLGGIGRGSPDAIHRATRSGGVNSKTTHIGRVKVGIGGCPI